MLGVINIVTKRAKDFSGSHVVIESELPVSIRALLGFGQQFRLFGKEGEVTSAVEYFQQHGPTFTLGREPLNNGAPYAVDSRGKPGVWGGYPATQANYAYMPTAYLRLILGDFEVNTRAELWKRQEPWSYGPYDNPGGFEQDTWLMLDVRHRAVLSSRVELSSRFYADAYTYVERLDQPNFATDCPNSRACIYLLHGTSRWMGLEEQATVDWTKDSRFPTLIGIDARLKDVDMRTDYADAMRGMNQRSVGIFPCANAAAPGGIPCSALGKQFAAYAEQKARPHPRVGLSAGVRVDIDNAYRAQASPRGAAVVEAWKGGTLKLIYAQAFRAPTVYERFYTDGLSQVAAPNLGPETVRSVEGSVEQKFRAQRLLLAGFGSFWNGLVAMQGLTPTQLAAAVREGLVSPGATDVVQYQNVSTLQSLGFSLTFEGAVLSGRLRYGLSFTGAYTRETLPQSLQGPGQTCSPPTNACPAVLPAAAQSFGNARVSYEIGGPWPTIGLVGRYAGARLAADSTPALDAPGLGAARIALTGKVPDGVPQLRRLGYGLSADYSFTSSAPFAVGPGTLANGTTELMPLDRFRATATIAYDLP